MSDRDSKAAFELFARVADLPEAVRDAAIAGSGLSEGVRARVRAMLRADLDTSPLDGGAAARSVVSAVLGEPVAPVLMGDYRVMARVGAGSTGVVFEAEQRSPRRRVALKALMPNQTGSAALTQFRREADALARLQHPGIAAVYEAGISDEAEPDQAYIAMEFVDGPPITTYATRERLDHRGAVRLLRLVVEAVSHAHARSVIHRDLKPANILVNPEGQPKVLDFGVARLSGLDGATMGESIDGRLVGTLAYMSPEQASGERGLVDARSDVFALGALLHELVTGRPMRPLRDLSLTEAVDAVRDSVAVDVNPLSAEVGRDLATIIATATHPDPARRYQSAAGLGEELTRWLDGRPIEARRDSTAYLLSRFVGRHRVASVSAVSVLAVILASAAIATVQASRLQRLNARADRLNTSLQDQLLESEVDRARMELRADGESRAERAMWALAADHPESDRVRWALWELYATVPCDATIALGAEVSTPLAPSLDGASVAVGATDGRLLVVSLETGSVRTIRTSAPIERAAWPEGGAVWTFHAGGEVHTWDSATGEAGESWSVSSKGRVGLARAAGEEVVVARWGRVVELLRRGAAEPVWSVEVPAEIAAMLIDRAAGEVVMAIGSGVRVLALADGRTIREIPGTGPKLALGEDHEGNLLVGGGDRVLRDPVDGRAFYRSASIHRAILPGPEPGTTLLAEALRVTRVDRVLGDAERVAFPVGSVVDAALANGRLVLLDGNGLLRVYRTAEPNPIVRSEHESWVFSVDTSSDGSVTASAGADGVVRLWTARLGEVRATGALPPNVRSRVVRLSPDGARLAVGASDGKVRLVRTDTGEIERTLDASAVEIYSLAWSADGRRLFVGADDRRVRVFVTGSESAEPSVTSAELEVTPRGLALDPPGARLYATGGESRLLALDPATLREAASYPLPSSAWSVDVAPDGGTIAAGLFDATVAFIDVASGGVAVCDGGHHLVVSGLRFSRSGELLATGAEDGAVVLWSVANRETLARLPLTFGAVPGLAWDTADDGLFAATSAGRVVRWDMRRPWRDARGNAEVLLREAGRGEQAAELLHAIRDPENPGLSASP